MRQVSEDERSEPLRLAHPPRAQPLQRHQHHLLHQVRGRLPVAQVTQAVEAHARREPAVKLGLGVAVDPRRGGRGRARRRRAKRTRRMSARHENNV